MPPELQRRHFLKKLSLGLPGLVFMGTPLSTSAAPSSRILLGIDVLAANRFAQLRGKRIGLLTHPAGVNRMGVSTIDVLRRAPEVRLTALFGPEHGIYGNEKANIPVDDKIDPRTGLPVYSLYGKFRRPTDQMLDAIDCMVVDLQDIGSRSYTYVSCMRYVIEEIFKAGKEIIILDRPNPLGGIKTDGPPLEKEWMSYVGAFQVPYVHGLTIGELANMAKQKPGVLDIPDRLRKRGKLQVIRMQGWSRRMMWTQTGLKWIPTSPAIPDLSAVMGYPMTGLGTQLGGFSHGYGTRLPFRLIQYPQTAPEVISATLRSKGIRGLSFPVIQFEVKGKPRRTTYTQVTDWNSLRPTELSLHMMATACAWAKTNPFSAATESLQGLFTKHVGDSRVIRLLKQEGQGIPIQYLLEDWERYNTAYRRESRSYWLYKS